MSVKDPNYSEREGRAESISTAVHGQSNVVANRAVTVIRTPLYFLYQQRPNWEHS